MGNLQSRQKTYRGQKISSSKKKLIIQFIEDLFYKFEVAYHYQFFKIYSSNEKKTFDRYSDNLQVVPNYQDFLVIKKMLKEKILSKDAIIINGQSGDFNTGNHIPEILMKGNSFNNFCFNNLM